jgi:uncharacterized protein (TIGR02118 family)
MRVICVRVLYPHRPGARFDFAYYAEKHMGLVRRVGGDAVLRIEVDKCVATMESGAPAPYAAIGRLYVPSAEAFLKLMDEHGAELVADIPKYTDIQPQLQISEVVSI